MAKKFGEDACKLQQPRRAIPHRAARDRLRALLDLSQCRQTERSLIQISVITEMDNVPAVQPGLARLLFKLGDQRENPFQGAYPKFIKNAVYRPDSRAGQRFTGTGRNILFQTSQSLVTEAYDEPSPAGIVGSMDDFFLHTRRHGIPRAAFKTISAGDGGQYEHRQ